MKGKIFYTFISRILISASALIVLLLTSRWFGPEVRGTISLLVVAQTIILLINDIASGPAMIYLVPRYNFRSLIIPAFSWSFLSSIGVPLLLFLSDMLPRDYIPLMTFIGLIQNFSNFFLLVLAAQQKIRSFNQITIIQALMVPVMVAILYSTEVLDGIMVWGIALIISQATGLLFGGALVLKGNSDLNPKLPKAPLNEILGKGVMAQLSTIAYIFSIRISYYLLDSQHGRDDVGIFSSGVSIMEAGLLLSSSVALIVYSRISNSEDENYNIRITAMLSKYCLLVTLPLLLVAAMIPEEFYLLLFGGSFKGITQSMIYLVPGLSMISFSTVITHYFSGKGIYRVNVISSVIGLLAAFIAGLILIPSLGITGAAITTGIGQVSSSLFTIVSFSKRSELKLLPGKQEINEIFIAIKNGLR